MDWTGLLEVDVSFFVVFAGEFPIVNEVRGGANSGDVYIRCACVQAVTKEVGKLDVL